MTQCIECGEEDQLFEHPKLHDLQCNMCGCGQEWEDVAEFNNYEGFEEIEESLVERND